MNKTEIECDTLIYNILSIKDKKGLSFLPEIIQATIDWKSKNEINAIVVWLEIKLKKIWELIKMKQDSELFWQLDIITHSIEFIRDYLKNTINL